MREHKGSGEQVSWAFKRIKSWRGPVKLTSVHFTDKDLSEVKGVKVMCQLSAEVGTGNWYLLSKAHWFPFCVAASPPSERRLKLFKTWKLMKYEEIICCEPVCYPALHWTGNCRGTPVGLKPSLAAGFGVCKGKLWAPVKSRRWKAGTAGLWTHAFSALAQIKLPNAVPGEAGGLSRVSKHFLTALSSRASMPFLFSSDTVTAERPKRAF